MKKLINWLMIVMIAMTAVSCGNPKETVLKAQIESGKKHCPMSMGMAGKLTSMSYDETDKIVKFDITLNKNVTDVKDLKADPETSRTSMRLALSKGDMKKLLEMMVDAGAGLDVTYKNRGSKDEFELKFTPEELKDILDNPMSEEEVNKMLLNNQIKAEKNRLPYTIEKGLKVTGIEDNGSSLVYTCEVDENLYEMPDMEKMKDELKNDMRKMLRDRAMRKQAELLSSLNKGFEYRYVGNGSGNVVTVSFTAAELGEIAGKKK